MSALYAGLAVFYIGSFCFMVFAYGKADDNEAYLVRWVRSKGDLSEIEEIRRSLESYQVDVWRKLGFMSLTTFIVPPMMGAVIFEGLLSPITMIIVGTLVWAGIIGFLLWKLYNDLARIRYYRRLIR